MAKEYINFVVNGMTSIRYFIPLTIEGNARGIKSRYFIYPSHKYNCPVSRNNNLALQQYAKQYNFDIFDISLVDKFSGDFFLVEGDGANKLSSKHKKYSITYMTDYIESYGRYIDNVDFVIFPSPYVSSLCDTNVNEAKSLYLGSPKYDVSFNNNEICNKYKISDNGKKAFVVLPRKRDVRKVDFKVLYESLTGMGFDILTKTRGKDPYQQSGMHGNYHYMDFSWFPHDSMEMIYISDIVINFSSTAIKECVMLNKPIVNFHVKPSFRRFDELYHYNYCIELGASFDGKAIQESIQKLLSEDLDMEFKKARHERLFAPGNISAKILDIL